MDASPSIVFTNELGQPVGEPLGDWTSPPSPPHVRLAGRFCDLAPLTPAHAPRLGEAYALDVEGRNWTYLPHGPYDRREAFDQWVEEASASVDPQFYAVLVEAGAVTPARVEGSSDSGLPARDLAVGIASYLRIAPSAGSIEVGHIHFSPLLQRTPAATEAMYLMMRYAFELGYRRYEWKCDALNAPSRRAAERLGFTFEGIFRQATVTRGRNRDTAWFACIDKEWPTLREAYERWLDPSNFDADGRQRQSLARLRAGSA